MKQTADPRDIEERPHQLTTKAGGRLLDAIPAELLHAAALAFLLGMFTCVTDPLLWTTVALLINNVPASTPMSVAGVFATILAAGWLLLTIHCHASDKLTTSWWASSRRWPDNNLTWAEVYPLVAFDHELDPLNAKRQIRFWYFTVAVTIQAVASISVLCLAIAAVHVLSGDPISNVAIEATESATPIVGIVLGAATIFFGFRQLRAKVRADSRQQWIVRARSLLGEVVAMVDTHRDLRAANKNDEADKLWTSLNTARLELELMLNPSEKDHRLLLYLIQRFCAWREPGSISQDAGTVRRSVATELDGTRNTQERTFMDWARILDANDRSELVSFILRLSHAVLKREWERVKHAR